MARRQVLDFSNGTRLTAIVDEAALRKVPGSREVMREQLRFLVGRPAHYKVTVLVVPNGAGTHTAVSGAFSLIDFPGTPGQNPASLYTSKSTGGVTSA